jgi:dihydrofolate synthase/folylpolyglutamate synthase
MRAVAEDVGANFEVLGEQIEFSCRFEASAHLGPHMRVGLSTKNHTYEHIPVPLPGEHQAQNCGLALAVLDKLRERGFDLPEMKIIDGLSASRIPGRMELIKLEPRVLLDGAHNPAAMAALVKSIGAHVPYDSMIMIFGCAADKDMDAMLDEVGRGADKVIFTRSSRNPRAADPEELARRFNARSAKMYQVAPTLEDAMRLARQAAARDDLICITGSFYLVGEAKKLLMPREKVSGHAATAS